MGGGVEGGGAGVQAGGGGVEDGQEGGAVGEVGVGREVGAGDVAGAAVDDEARVVRGGCGGVVVVHGDGVGSVGERGCRCWALWWGGSSFDSIVFCELHWWPTNCLKVLSTRLLDYATNSME